jgi:hypothetical protein
MSLIVKSSYFLVNPDRVTGHVVTSDGAKSRKLFTKWQAKQYVYSLREIQFDDAETKVLIEMIENSSLIESNTPVEQTTDEMADMEAKIRSGCRPTS